ncbi:MAG: type VI secretion system membrane subunit TssM [Pseudomonadota bacterium]
MRLLLSPTLWTFIGLVLLSGLLWVFGPLVSFGDTAPLTNQLVLICVIAAVWLIWLLRILFRQIRAARANQSFVSELAVSKEKTPSAGEENVAEVNEKFQNILNQMKRSKLGGRKFLREMPWYVFIGPPGTGKTTALKQAGLHFPIDLSDDIKGVGGTRNCDWFFTEEAILIDTAGRYVEQKSDPEADAVEWLGFLDLLKKYRGRNALNGVIVTLSVEELLGNETELREHGREIRRRLTELSDKLEFQLPVYLMLTKLDLLPGFESFFGPFGTRAREQVWGATLPVEAQLDGSLIDREMRALQARLEERMPDRIAEDIPISDRAQVFRFPVELDRLTQPLKIVVDTVFGESRYEDTPWLRGFYLTSATQEGSPLDRMIGAMAASFGLTAPPTTTRASGEKRSYFLKNFLTHVVFQEAGLGTFDPKSEERRSWIWRGTLAGASLATIIAFVFFAFSFQRYSGAIEQQERQLTALSGQLANVASRQAPTDPLDLPLALAAATDAAAATVQPKTGPLTVFGPSAKAELDHTQKLVYDHALRDILEPRMVALLEATMWRNIRDPEFLLGALKTYQMMTGLAPYDAEFVGTWWVDTLPEFAPIDAFPTDASLAHQLAAFDRMSLEEDRIAPDNALVVQALESVCTVPIAVRAYRSLMSQPEVAGLDDWIPAEHGGPNSARIFERLSGKTLRIGLPGAFTYDGFHTVILPIVPEVAAEIALDRAVFAGGCAESAEISDTELQKDMLKLYYEDFIAQWDSLLRDIRLSPITDLQVASRNLKDLSAEDSALKRLLAEVVSETYLTRPPEESGGSGNDKAQKGILKAATKKLGKFGKMAKKGAKLASGGGGETTELPGEAVSRHFLPIRGMVQEVDGLPPMLGDVELALTALSNEIQTVLAGPSPEQTLLARGGLPQLIGAVANVAATLPDPMDDWIASIAGETVDITTDAVIRQLDARWRADVLPFCTSATAGRYPFDPSSAIDVNTLDFARLFGSGGLFDTFINDTLGQYIDTATRPWQWRQDFGLDPAVLAPYERARAIRDALFPGGAGPVMAFSLEPKDLSPNASRVTLNVDGQNLTYFNSATRPAPMTWPGPDQTNMVTLTFAPVDGSAEIVTSEIGSWALLRLIRKGRLSSTQFPELFKLRLGARNFVADFDLRANSVVNPFDLEIFSNFSCPQGFP